MTGIELVEKLTADKKDVLFTLLAGHADAPAAVKAMQENVLDFLLKPASAKSLLGLVARAYAQYYDVDWDFVGEDLDDIEDSLKRLTTREQEVLDLLVDGLSSRDIGSQLGVFTKTVEAHRARINDKMRSDDLAHLVRMVLAVANRVPKNRPSPTFEENHPFNSKATFLAKSSCPVTRAEFINEAKPLKSSSTASR